MNDSLYLYGLNHKTAPVKVRERLAFAEQLCKEKLPELMDADGINEALILSTCNRLEVIVESSLGKAETKNRIVEFLCKTHRIDAEDFDGYSYQLSGDEAVNHLFRVASSLDSMVIGEEQITGQVRKAYALAVEAQTAKKHLHKLLHHAFYTAKRVRSETRIGGNRVSVVSAAVRLGKQIYGSLENKSVLLVGAGKMTELALKHFIKAKAKRVVVANRTRETAEKLASDYGAEVVDFDSLGEALRQADITVCSTAAKQFVITAAMLEKAAAFRTRPTVLIDISLPRSVEPPTAPIENLHLYNLDDFAAEAEEKCREQEYAVAHAEQIVESEARRFKQTIQMSDAGKSFASPRDKMRRIAIAELEKNRHRLGTLSLEQERAVERLLIGTVNKITDPILYGLRKSQEQGETSEFTDILNVLLGADERDDGEFVIENDDENENSSIAGIKL